MSKLTYGVGTSAFQIEGSADTRGKSIWDTFCDSPFNIQDESNGKIACDHVNRLESDLDLIESLGVDAYRFSISWPRVRPTGAGSYNSNGVDFYDRLVTGLLDRGIQPYVTLNHWDLPIELQAAGGWANRETVNRFIEYAAFIAEHFGDRLAAITTHNEPWVISTLGHGVGAFAPGIRNRKTAMLVAHNLLVSHGMAVQAMRTESSVPMGIVLNQSPVYPVTDSQEDIDQARLEDGKLNRWFMDPLFKGSYPADVLEDLEDDAPDEILLGDMNAIKTPIDFLGINYYTRLMASASGPYNPTKSGLGLTSMGWEIYPEGLTEVLLRNHREYNVPPMIITENGAAFDDEVIDGEVHDQNRIEYLSSHIAAVKAAQEQGVEVTGYFAWSLLDNFEWTAGYNQRFGLIRVDYETQERILKDSAKWYGDFIASPDA